VKLISRVSLLSAITLIASGVVPAGLSAAAPPSVWIASAADRVFSSSTRPVGAPSAINLYAARGEHEAAQIVVRSPERQSSVRIEPTALTGPGGAVIPLSNILVRRAYNHPRITKLPGDVQQPPDGGTAYYDALIENVAVQVLENVTQPYHYAVDVPATQTPGTYTGNAIVRSSIGDVPVPVTLKVYDVTLPAANASTFKMNNWSTSAGWDYRGTINAIPGQYGVQMYDANWWRVIESFARNHKRHRNNVVFTDFQALLIPNTTIDAGNTNYTFGWATFDRYVETFINAGALQYIYTPHLLEYGANSTVNVEILKNVSGTTQRVLVPWGSAEANAYFDKVFPALKAHLDAKGWTDRFYFSALDEPSQQVHVDAARWLYAKYRQYFPNPRTNEAHLAVLPGLEPDLTTATPYTVLYDRNAGYYQNRRIRGADLWLYNCIVPQGAEMNRFISYHLAKTRLTPWYVWKIDGTGYLHWGWNFWFDDPGNPVTPSDTFNGAQTGDNWLVRPNKPAYDVYDSLRSETQLDGLEDYELLTQLARTKPLVARSIAQSLITNGIAYSRSGADVDMRHKMILDELSGTPDSRYPFSDGFSNGEGYWVHTQGSWAVEPTGEYVQSATDNWGYVAAVKGRAYRDMAASVDFKITGVNPNGGNTNWAGLMIRSSNATDMDTGYLVAVRNTGEVFVYRSTVSIGSAAIPGYQPGAYTRLRVVARGNTIQVYVAGNQDPVLTVNDAAYRAGHVGLVTGGTAVRFDNFKVNPDVNVADGTTVTASSSYSGDGWHARALVDGQQGSAGASLGYSSLANYMVNHTESVTVDLGSQRSLSRVDLWPRSDGANTGAGFPVDFNIQVSTDGTTWTTVATRTGYPRPAAAAQAFPFATRSARYIRVTGTNLRPDQFGHFHLQFAELEAFGGNLAAGRTVTASSSYESPPEGWSRAGVTDGAKLSNLYNSMGWSSVEGAANRTEWVAVDLGGPSQIGRVDLYARTDGPNTGAGFPVDFTIQVSSDGTTWTNVATRTGYPRPDHTAQSFTFPATTARHVRVVGTNLRADPGGTFRMQLGELEVG
jgi:hypothetical protein